MKTRLFIIWCFVSGLCAQAQSDSIFRSEQRLKNPSDNRGRIFLSNDQGTSWQRRDKGFPEDASVNAWALVSNLVVAGTENHGIYISGNGLKSWHASNRGMASTEKINALFFHKGILFAGSFLHGVFTSHNEGDTWQKSSLGLENMSVRSFYAVGSTVFAGTDGGIYMSEDLGQSWIPVARGMQVNAFTSLNGILFAATNSGAIRSDDGGRTWPQVLIRGALFNIATEGANIVSLSYNGAVSVTNDKGSRWVDLDRNFSPYSFRITPASNAILSSPWRKALKWLEPGEPFHASGLPEEDSFNQLLITPYGIITGVSPRGGC